MERSVPASPSLAASSPEPNRNSQSSVIMLSPVHVHANGSSPSSSLRLHGGPFGPSDDSVQQPSGLQSSSPVAPLSPRSSMRNRMERHKLRQQASSAAASPVSAAAAGARASAR
jgi:hypothetical protein